MDIQRYFDPLRHWLNSLNTRERNSIIAAAVFLVISLFYLAIWEPVFNNLHIEQQKFESERQLYYWMKDAAAELQTLQSTGTRLTNRFKNQSISSLAELSAQSTGIKQNIKKLDSDSKGVKVELDQVSFDQLILWLSDMSQKYSIQVTSLHIEKQKDPGTVNARISLERDPA
ncbi:MAG: type II secretion system protein M [Gammaproteobacteria bacterium]|nr:type II secretion system protein M [Gammaproteobacteria bacterium]MDH5735896.1 type II secretion system protein M [Gammaproteobacteria bacterium]